MLNDQQGQGGNFLHLFEEGEKTIKTEEQIARGIRRNEEKSPDEPFRRKNLKYLASCWLKQGRDIVKIAQAVTIHRHMNDELPKGVYVYIEQWRRLDEVPSHFQRLGAVRLDHADLETFLAYIHQAKVLLAKEEEPSISFSPEEIFENLTESQRQTFANILSDVALSHQLAGLYANGQLQLATLKHLAAAALQTKYKAELQELRDMVEGNVHQVKGNGKGRTVTEHVYQKWFEAHSWVFGTEYVQRINNLRDIDTDTTIDMALQTSDGFIDILELKTPEAPVLQHDPSHKTYYFSQEVSKVLAQAAKYLRAVERRADTIYTQSRLQERAVLFVRPRVRIVIGRSHEWNTFQQEYFRRLGASLHSIEIMTFDHVMTRAEQLIARYDHPEELEIVNVDGHHLLTNE